MKTLLNVETWNRKEHFYFFKAFDEPFFGVTVNINCDYAYAAAKQLGVSFFTFYLHKTLAAVNQIECFRYRIIKDEVFIFDNIGASATIMRKDHTFGFSYIDFNENLLTFSQNVLHEINRIQTTNGLFTREYPENLIHFSALPWLNFTSLSHARAFTFPDSCPKISFGKMILNENGKRTMPLSIHVHHGLIDGFDVGRFVDLLQNLMNGEPSF